MFDIGFSEIVLIAVVALVVLGPERLPKAARTLGHLFGRLQRYVNEVKADISREMEFDELRKLQGEMQGAARELERTVTAAASEVSAGVHNVERELNQAAAEGGGGMTEASAASNSSAATAITAPTATVVPAAAPSQPPAPPSGAPANADPRQAALPGFEKI